MLFGPIQKPQQSRAVFRISWHCAQRVNEIFLPDRFRETSVTNQRGKTMSSNIEHLLQEAYILATGKMASPKTLSELKKLEGEGDWAPLVELINTYFDAYEHAVGGRVKLIQLLALNGFGMVLPERDAIQIRNDFGTLGWDSWFSIMANVVLMEGTALDNRAFAIQTVIENLQKTGKAGVLEHAGPQATINAFLKKITDHPDTLKEVAKGLDAFSATLTPRGTITAVVDGYLKNATVFVDANGNNRMDSGEFSIRTNDKGFWVLPHHLEGTRMIALGGQDLMTNKPFKGILSAPLGATVINPFTALVDTFFTRGGGRTSLEKATDAVRSMLGLPETVHLLTYEPLSVLIDRSSSPAEKLAALKVQMQALQIMNLVSSTSKLLFALGHSGKGRANTTDEGMAGEIAAADAVFRAIIDLFLHGEEKVFDLVDTENLRELVTQAAAETNITLAPSAVEKMGAVLSETNARIAEAETIEEVAKVAGVVVSDMVDAVVEAASQGTEGLEAALGQVVTDFTGQQLSEKIDGAQPGLIAPDESGIDPEGNPIEEPTEAPTQFTVRKDESTDAWTVGAENGTVTLTETDTHLVFTPETGDSVEIPKTDFGANASLEVDGILTGTAAVLTGKTITGGGTVAVTKLEETLDADLSLITTVNLTAALTVDKDTMDFAYETGDPKYGAHAFIKGNLGTATLTISGLGDIGFNNATINEASFVLNQTPGVTGAALVLLGGDHLSGSKVSGTGGVRINLANDTDLSHFDRTDGLEVQAYVPVSVDITENLTLLSKVNVYRLANDAAVLTLTAEQAHTTFSSKVFVDNVTVKGSDGDQRIDLSYSYGTNTIAGGLGADTIILGDGIDTISLAFGSSYVIFPTKDGIFTTFSNAVPLVSAGDLLTFYFNDGFKSVTLTGSTLESVQSDVDTLLGTNQVIVVVSNDNDLILFPNNLEDTIIGGAFSDGEQYARSDSYVGAYDVIHNFTVGTDKFKLLTASGYSLNVPTTLERFSDVTGDLVTTGQELINLVLNSPTFLNLLPNQAGIIVVTSGEYAGTYLYVNDSVAPLDSGQDLFVKLMGVHNLGGVGILTVSDYFV
jgi:hypothetical protein